MPKYIVFPEGYDPIVAAGPPDSFCIKNNILWSEEDTKKQKELEKLAVICDEKPQYGRCYQEIEQEDLK